MYRKNVAGQHLPFALVAAADGSALTGATVTARRSLDGAAQANATGTVSELGNGQYNLALSQADTNANQIGILLTATGAIPAHFTITTTAADPTNATTFGLANLDAAVSTRASQTSVDTIDDFLDTEMAATLAAVDTEVASILADTNELQTDWANGGRLDLILDARASQASVDDLPTNAELATALDPLPTAAENADAVWDEALAGHAGVGSAGAALSAAGSAGDPWSTALPGAYGAGTAGNILGTNLDATVSSRASQASVNTIDDLLDTEVAALQTSVNDLPTNAELATALGTADDAVLAAIAALNNLSAAQVNAEVLDVLSTDVQTELAALPAAATTLTNMLKTLYAYTTNEVRETSSLQTLRNRANSASIAQHSVTDDGTTYVRGSGS